MTQSVQEFNKELVKRVVHFLWRQWGQVGLASANVEPRDGWIMDPEALLLLSASYARHDSRLFDEIMDWLVKNIGFINISRLRSIEHKYGFCGHDVLSVLLARVALDNKRLKWKPVIADSEKEPEPLFMDAEGNPAPDFGHRDEFFMKAGFLRGKVELRGLSRRFNPVKPECALLRLRALFGATARADIMAYLLTHETGHPSGIARETGFSQKNIQDILVDMSASQTVSMAKFEGRMKHYFILKQYRSRYLHNPENPDQNPKWVVWSPIYRILEILLFALRDIRSKGMSELMLASSLRDIKERINPLLHQAGQNVQFSDESGYTGVSYTPVFFDELDAWLAQILGEAR